MSYALHAGIRRRVVPAVLMVGALILLFNATQSDAHHRCRHKSRDCAPRQTPADTSPPETTITSGPAAASGSNSVSVSFSSSEPDSKFEWRLSSGS